MKEQQFFTKQPKQAVPPPIHIDRRKIPSKRTDTLDKALDGLTVSMEASSHVKEVLTKTSSLPEDYKARVAKEAGFLENMSVEPVQNDPKKSILSSQLHLQSIRIPHFLPH